MHINFETKFPKQTRITLQNYNSCRVQETNNLTWSSGGHFEDEVIENQYACTHVYKFWLLMFGIDIQSQTKVAVPVVHVICHFIPWNPVRYAAYVDGN